MKLMPTRISRQDAMLPTPEKKGRSSRNLQRSASASASVSSSSSEQGRSSRRKSLFSTTMKQNPYQLLNETNKVIVIDNMVEGMQQLTASDESSLLFLEQEQEQEQEQEEELSTGTQESEYANDCSSRYTDSSNRNGDGGGGRLTCFVYKRKWKAGFGGKMKQSYAVASERSKHLGHRVHQNMNLGLHMNKDFWKLGARMGKSDKPVVDVVSSAAAVGGGGSGGSGGVANSAAISATPHDKVWERRRLVLEGNYLMYYYEDAEFEEEDCACAGTGVGVGPVGTNSNANATANANANANMPPTKWQVAGLQRLKDKFHIAHVKTPSSQGAINNNPKGVIDLVSEYATATVVPITPHSFAPTPYCLAIMVKSEVKWMLCFDDEKEITKWLRNLTKVALTQSVDRYAKNRGRDYNVRDRDLKAGSGEKKRRSMTPVHKEARSQDTPTVDNRGLVATAGYDISTPRGQKVVSAISDGSVTSAKTLMCWDSYITVVLVNSSFLYIFVVVEEALSLPHMFVFLMVNLLTWLHLTRNISKRVGVLEGDGGQLERDSIEQSCASPIGILYNNSLVSNISTEESPSCGGQIEQALSSSSYIEKRKSLDEDDDDLYRPKAGSTTVKIQKLNEKRNEYEKEKVAWMAGDPSIIHLRGQDYLTTRKKFPSSTSLYELVEVDTFDSDEHLTDVGQRFQFPDFDYGDEGNWCAPDTLIISFALPTTAPKLGRSVSDGKGYIVIGYYRIRTDVRKTLDILTNEDYDGSERERRLQELFPTSEERVLVNGIKLWEKWCRTSGSDPEMQKRLKFIPRGENLQELGVPSWICRYNGKPMLIKRPGETSFIFSHPDERTLEIDINLHPFPYMFKQAMSYLKDHYFFRMPMTFGFVIEGREYDELPEVLLGDPIHLDKPGSVLDKRGSVLKSDVVFTNMSLSSF